MAGLGLPHAAIREQVADAVDLVVHQARLRGGTRRVVAVAEVVRVAGGPARASFLRLRGGRPSGAPPLAGGAVRRDWRGGDRVPAWRRGRKPRSPLGVPRRVARDLDRRGGAAAAWRASALLAAVAEPLRRARTRGPRHPRRRSARRLAAARRWRAALAAGWLVGGSARAARARLGPAAGDSARSRCAAAPARGARPRRRPPPPADGRRARRGHGRSARRSATGRGAGAGRATSSAPPPRALALGEPTEPVPSARWRARAARTRGTRSWRRSCCSATRAATWRGSCASSRRRARPRSAPAATRAPRPRRPASRPGSCSAARRRGGPRRARPPGFLAGLLATPLSTWLAGLALVLQGTALVCVRRLAWAAA